MATILLAQNQVGQPGSPLSGPEAAWVSSEDPQCTTISKWLSGKFDSNWLF